MPRVKKKLILSAVLCFAPAAVLAHDSLTLTLDSVHKVREVVVAASRVQREAIPAQRIGSKQLEGLGSQSVADALRFFAGLQTKDYGGVGGMKTVDIRSMGSSHLGIYYDGVQIGNAQNGQVDLGQLSLDNVEEIALYNGQKSAIFQPASDYASAAAVYIRTREPRLGDRQNSLRAKLRHGTSGAVTAFSALYEQRLARHITASINAEALTATGKYKFRYKRNNADGSTAYDTTATRQNGDMWALRAEANLFGRFEQGAWTFKAYTYNSERGIPGAIVNNVWRRGERQWDHNTFVQGQVRWAVTPRYDTRLTAKYAYYNTHYVNNDTTTMLIDNTYRQQELYVSTANVYELLKGWHVALSYDYRWNKLNADLRNFAYPTRHTHMVAVATTYDHRRFRLQASLLATVVDDHTRLGGDKSTMSRLSPAIYASWAPLEGDVLTLRAFAKKSFRVPTFNELYYTDVGNASLQPETALQYDLGMVVAKSWPRSFLSRLRLQADAYYNSVSDKIIAYPRGQQFRWTMLNLGRVHIVGVDALAEATIRPVNKLNLTCRLQYTYQQARDVSDPTASYYNDQIPYTPWHSGTAIVAVNYGAFDLNYSFIYTGERYSQQENIAFNHVQPWYTHDMTLSYRLPLRHATLRMALAVNNIFGQDYEVIANYPMPKRNYVFTLGVDL